MKDAEESNLSESKRQGENLSCDTAESGLFLKTGENIQASKFYIKYFLIVTLANFRNVQFLFSSVPPPTLAKQKQRLADKMKSF